jgi:hypothetical protein
MDQNQNQQQSIFGLNVDPAISAHLSEAARWGRFLAIVGFIFCGLIIIIGLVALASVGSLEREFGGRGSGFGSGLGAGLFVVYILIAVIYFFPCLFLLRFSNAMKIAIAANDQVQLTESFKNLKVMFRYVGILTIIILCFYALALIVGVLGAAMR